MSLSQLLASSNGRCFIRAWLTSSSGSLSKPPACRKIRPPARCVKQAQQSSHQGEKKTKVSQLSQCLVKTVKLWNKKKCSCLQNSTVRGLLMLLLWAPEFPISRRNLLTKLSAACLSSARDWDKLLNQSCFMHPLGGWGLASKFVEEISLI